MDGFYGIRKHLLPRFSEDDIVAGAFEQLYPYLVLQLTHLLG